MLLDFILLMYNQFIKLLKSDKMKAKTIILCYILFLTKSSDCNVQEHFSGGRLKDLIFSKSFYVLSMSHSLNFYAGKAITLVCNGFTGDDCTPQNVLNYLGSTGNGVAPVDMNFQQIGNSTGISNDSIPNRKRWKE